MPVQKKSGNLLKAPRISFIFVVLAFIRIFWLIYSSAFFICTFLKIKEVSVSVLTAGEEMSVVVNISNGLAH